MTSFSPALLNYFYHLDHVGRLDAGENVYFLEEGSLEQGSKINFSVRIENNRVISVRFQCYGGVALMAMCEYLSIWLEDKLVPEVQQLDPHQLLAALQLSRLHIHVAVRLVDLVQKIFRSL